jgi:endonuclease/exonuclease/phosphatase family metal-dependent hydrolase
MPAIEPNTQTNEVETGSYAPPLISPVERSKITVVTFNIRYAVGSFLITGSLLRRAGIGLPHRRTRLVARHIKQAAKALSNGVRLPPADIVALQEADQMTRRAGGLDVARELARELGMDYALALTQTTRVETPHSKEWYLDFEERISSDDPGDTGIALLTRLPFTETKRVKLPGTECTWRPRLALAAKISIDARRSLHIFNAHIDPHANTPEQLAQHEAMLKCADEAACDAPVVLLGDYNTLRRPACLAMRELLESKGYTTPMPTGVATWRAGLIRLHTDWIFVRGARVTKWGVARGLGVSDHWPVWAEIDLTSGAAK